MCTVATGVTLLRLLACSSLIVWGIAESDTARVLEALALNMILDSVDGEVARRQRRETVFGAQADGAVDRFLAMAVVLTIAFFRGGVTPAAQAVVVVAQFVLVDQILCGQFLRFGLWSPDHFYVIDETVWRLNWSPISKIAGNVPLLLFTVSPVTAWMALPAALALIVARVYSYAVVQARARERLPEHCLAIGPEARTASSRVATSVEPRGGEIIRARRLSGGQMADDEVLDIANGKRLTREADRQRSLGPVEV